MSGSVSLLPTEDEIMLADAAAGFLDERSPVSAFRALRDAGQTHDPALWSEMAQMGWTGVLVPEDVGGSDMGHGAAGVLARAMGERLTASPFLSTAVIAATALRQVASDRAADALGQIAAGGVTYALALDEGPKFAPDALAMTAQASGNGFRLSGDKTFVVGGASAERLLVAARTDGGMTLFDLPANRAGISAEAMDMIDASDAARLTFEDVEATGEDVLGQVNAGDAVLRPALQAGQAALAAELGGIAAGAFGMTVEYLKDRKQFGVPIGVFQALQHRAADLWCETELTASAITHAGRMLDSAPDDADLAVSLAKARASDTARRAVIEGVQMHGGIGMTDAFDIGLYMKRARVAAEWLGDYGHHAAVVARHRGII